MGGARYFVKADVNAREKGPYTLEVIRQSFDNGLLKETALLREENATETVTLRAALGMPGAPPPKGTDVPEEWKHEAPRRSQGSSRFVIGVVMLGAGIGLTMCGRSAAASSGGTYVVFTGLIVWGVVNIIRGLASRGG